MKTGDGDQIDPTTLTETMTLDELKAAWVSHALDMTRIMRALEKAAGPLFVGPDGAVDAAIRFIEECQCR